MDESLSQEQQPKNINNGTIYFLHVILVEYIYRLLIQAPLSLIRSWSRHPLSLITLFILLFPVYLFAKCVFSIMRSLAQIAAFHKYPYIINVFFGGLEKPHQSRLQQFHDVNNDEDDGDEEYEDDDLQKYLERCSICFDSKLDLCLEYCRDQFCLGCFQRYVTEVVKSSWGLSVTKIKCPVCRVTIPQSEWTRYVPVSIVSLYGRFNQPYRKYSRCCWHCESEMVPCDFARVYEKSQSKVIANMIQDCFHNASLHCESQASHAVFLPATLQQQNMLRLFNKTEWRNATLPDIHLQLMQCLIRTCKIVDQMDLIKSISKKILQLEIRSDTWRRLQFDYISLFPNMACPTCSELTCLQCGQEAHQNQTCEENMVRLIDKCSREQDYDTVETLKWKMENSRKCPSCSIMINRDEGCNKVECTLCGFSFCWECRSLWSESCGYFVCASKKHPASNDNDEVALLAVEESAPSNTMHRNSRAELGVPDVDSIHSRLHELQ